MFRTPKYLFWKRIVQFIALQLIVIAIHGAATRAMRRTQLLRNRIPSRSAFYDTFANRNSVEQRYYVQPRFPTSNQFALCMEKRRASTSTNFVSEAAVAIGNEVILKNEMGRGVVIQKQRNGWLSVQLSHPSSPTSVTAAAGKVINVRKSDVKHVLVNPIDRQQSKDDNGCSDIALDRGSMTESIAHVVLRDTPQYDDIAASNIAAATATAEATAATAAGQERVRLLQAPVAHAKCRRWIVFSDLHVKAASISTCEQVLEQVHRAAVERDAGILFLGDFWHVRGSLSVDLLNRVLLALRQWKQPVIMIPGNHDQVTLGGKVHALEPLQYAFDPGQMLLISEPAVCLGALWIPYRRDGALMRHLLRNWNRHNYERCLERGGGRDRGEEQDVESVSAIFCHADVRGAFMNDNIRSKEGLDLALFPPNVPIYSGHFHKPHELNNRAGTAVTYVGSPYQTSLSEAGQQKYLYCLEVKPGPSGGASLQWTESDRWAIDVGSKYFKATSPSDAVTDSARAGDRVVLQVPAGSDNAARLLTVELQRRDVQVELRHEANPMKLLRAAPAAAAADGSAQLDSSATECGDALDVDVDSMDPLTIFNRYTDLVFGAALTGSGDGLNPSPQSEVAISAAAALREAVTREGRATLERLMHTAPSSSTATSLSPQQSASNDSESASADHETHSVPISSLLVGLRDLRLVNVQLKNFGPYGLSPVNYPLAQRGLVLLRGQSNDGTGADSNGSGKTTLAMSVLWGLTGALDARLASDSRPADVAFDSRAFNSSSSSKSKSSSSSSSGGGPVTAEVAVSGFINGIPFEVVRRRNSKRSELLFSVDGRSLTTQSVKDTQAVIDDVLGVKGALLQRSSFFGQHSHTLQSLLGLSDTRLKSELSVLVSTDLWVAATQDVRSQERASKAQLLELQVQAQMRREEGGRLNASFLDAEREVSSLKAKLVAAQQILSAESLDSDPPSAIHNNGSSVQTQIALTDELSTATARLGAVEQQLSKLRAEDLKAAVGEVLSASSGHRKALSDAERTSNACKERLALSRSDLSDRMRSLSKVDGQLKSLESTYSSTDQAQQKLHATYSDVLVPHRAADDATAAAAALDEESHSSSSEQISFDDPSSAAAAIDSKRSQLRSSHEQQLTAAATTQMSIDETQATVRTLESIDRHGARMEKEGDGCHHEHSISIETNITTTTAVAVDADACPTCGQQLPADTRQRRLSEARELLDRLVVRVAAIQSTVQRQRRLIDFYDALKVLAEKSASLALKRDELEIEKRKCECEVLHCKNSVRELEDSVAATSKVVAFAKQQLQTAEDQAKKALAATENSISSLVSEEQSLRVFIDQLKRRREEAQRHRTAANATVVALHERLERAHQLLNATSAQLQNVSSAQAANERRAEQLTESLPVLEQLLALFGARGIQNYIFRGTVMQLEGIANTYLQILADSGIQLTLQNDQLGAVISQASDIQRRGGAAAGTTSAAAANGGGEDRIVKSVWVRSTADGVLRERALSQLSGGQWRRVSLALDLAFAELIRRRGVLRCNLLVMDEILTHLDAAGRESVGRVLRMLTRSPSDVSDNAAPSALSPALPVALSPSSQTAAVASSSKEISDILLPGSENAYETVIIILQDLAATELEEAFDRIDVVQKQSDSATVIVDGI